MSTPSNISMGATVNAGTYATRTWRIGPSSGQLSGFTDGLEAMRQAVEIALNIKRYHWQIYTPNVGHELDVLGLDYDTARVRLQSQIKEALSADDRITGISDYRFSQEEDAVTVSFTVHTIFGDLEAEVSA